MARLDDKQFALDFELKQLQRDRNRLERIKQRTDEDLLDTKRRIKEIRTELDRLRKPVKKTKPKKLDSKLKEKKKEEEPITFEVEGLKPEESEVEVDASSMTAAEDSKPAKKTSKKETEKTTEDDK